ncbi:MAG: hybrid sensor histidine kinase/response regulator [Kiritimatiellae bacterium]|nr:hybrid sensor histidine kinase/response regulator [Kiritimatiellia bacterium]
MDTAVPIPRVLVIDDEMGPRESLRILLKMECEVLCASSVDDGLRLFREKTPDLVIMDIRMPDQSGIDGLREIRKLDVHVSIIMLTGYGTLETAQEALRLGANDYLKKPFDTGDMFRVVRRQIKRTQVERRCAHAAVELDALNRQFVEQLKQRDHLAVLGQKSMELAHDISSPLTAIMGYVSMLADQLHGSREQLGKQYEESMECLTIIDKSVTRCHELLDFWRSQKIGSKRERRPVSLSAVIKDIVKAVKPLAMKAGIAIKVQALSEPWQVMADSIQVFRAIQNIITNAIQSLAGPGGWVAISCRTDGSQVEVCVEDNGCGIAQANIEKISQPYFTTKEQGLGMGLGLYITRSVIEDHGGTIQIESQLHKGTRMIVRLPLYAADQLPGATVRDVLSKVS